MVRYILLGLAVAVFALAGYGWHRWQRATRALHDRLEAERRAEGPAAFDPAVLDSLPAPVRRYLRAVLPEGRPVVTAVRLEQAGTFDMGEDRERWRRFTAEQRVVMRRPGFIWDARIALLPGLPVRVRDAYVAGEGILRAAVAGLVGVAEQRGTPEIAEGELMRFLAESPLYPSVLLPGQGVRWEAIDDVSARATLADGGIEVSLIFHFGEDGLVDAVRAESRGRTVGGQVVPTPWEGRWWGYTERDGVRIPLEGEVAWITPEGRKPYWRGQITKIAYAYSR